MEGLARERRPRGERVSRSQTVSHWFICYEWRTARGANPTWIRCNDMIDADPWTWLCSVRSKHIETDWNILWATPIDKETFDEHKDNFG